MSSYHWHRYNAAESFKRILEGENPWVAFGDFLDDWRRSDYEDRLELAAQPLEKASTLDQQRWAALFAGAIEQLCTLENHPVPSWTKEPCYYLQESWFPSARKEEFRRLVAETTPEVFKRRKVFVTDRVLMRV
jgi:hypothetical protein